MDILLTDAYECRIDSKGRLALPNGLKKELTSVIKEDFIVKRSLFARCLELLPRATWQKENEKVQKLNMFVAKNITFIRNFKAGVKTVELDSSSRILIPKELLEFAGIDKDVVLAPLNNKLEIWDKKIYEQTIAENAPLAGQMAEEILGDTVMENTDE